jgi:LacI family transcriptional regulator
MMNHRRHIAVILDSADPYPRKVLLGIAAYVRETANWSLYVEDKPLEKLPDLRTWHGDGMLITFLNRRLTRLAEKLAIPVVGIEGGLGWYDPASNIPYFATDNVAVGQLAAEHFLEQGFLHLAYYGIPKTRNTTWATERAASFEECARKAKVDCSIFPLRGNTPKNWQKPRQDMVQWLLELPKPVGILAANDARAQHLLEACSTANLRVPEDIAVLGVDNDEVLCELTVPTLSSVELGARSLGYHAAALLDRLIDGKNAQVLCHPVAPKGVVTRRSTSILVVQDPEVAAAVTYIRDHACDPILSRDVVEATGISRSTLEPRFKSVMGRTIHAEIQRVQIQRARHLIATTDLPLKQVAMVSGFAHVNYLTTVFRRQLGTTPAEYRKSTRCE